MCVPGKKLVDWTVEQQQVSPQVAVGMWQSLLEVQLISHVGRKYHFENKNYFYQFEEETTAPRSVVERRDCKAKLPKALALLQSAADDVLKRSLLHKNPSDRTSEDIKNIVEMIKPLKALQEFRSALESVAEVAEIETLVEDSKVFGKGQAADYWYVVLSGKVKETSKSKSSTWTNGDSFGNPDEMTKRQSKAEVESDVCHLLKIDKENYISLQQEAEEERAKPPQKTNTEKYEELCSILSSNSKQILLENEYNNLEDIMEAAREDFQEIGLKLPQITKIEKFLQKLNQDEKKPPQSSKQPKGATAMSPRKLKPSWPPAKQSNKDSEEESDEEEKEVKKPPKKNVAKMNFKKPAQTENDEERDSDEDDGDGACNTIKTNKRSSLKKNKIENSEESEDEDVTKEAAKPTSRQNSKQQQDSSESSEEEEEPMPKQSNTMKVPAKRIAKIPIKKKKSDSKNRIMEIAGEKGVLEYMKRLVGWKKSTIQTRGQYKVYKFPLMEKHRDDVNKIRFCQVGATESDLTPKTILLVGQTGSGKTTMIEGMVNFLFGISFEDSYRLSLVDLEESEQNKSQTHSQTDWITAYTIPPSKFTVVDYPITIIDMPGFGDTRGIKRDQALTESLTKLFSSKDECSINSIDAVCFVAKAPDTRLTPEQQYIFSTILGLFGKDIRENIHALISWVDNPDSEPPVLNALKEAQVPVQQIFKFNNDAVYPKRTGMFTEVYWDMGTSGYEQFFDHLTKAETKSVVLTNETLAKRKEIDSKVKSLQIKLVAKMKKIEENENLQEELTKKTQEKCANEGFYLRIPKEKMEKIPTKEGEYVIYCSLCKHECQLDSHISEDEEIADSVLMEDGKCIACRGKCPWEKHESHDYRMRKTKIVIEQFDEAKEERHKSAEESIKHLEAEIAPIQEEKDRLIEEVEKLVAEISELLDRLRKIALKKQPVSKAEYLKSLIQVEEQDRAEGWEGRKAMLKEMLTKEEIIGKIYKGEMKS